MTEILRNSEDADRGVEVGLPVKFKEGCAWSASEFEDDVLTEEFLARENTFDLSGRRGIIVGAELDEGVNDPESWLVYTVRLPCDSLIQIQSGVLEALSPLEQLAYAMEDER